ncbi:uncharacterized protein LOC120655610 isoform X1 [Panicum virgatum]|uniref:Uncharacterized protein n=1 Tax=Panicum virgatum TaxID=38727 RepID=A0A8T0WNH5_PANVG|nr:uncharacterized protein LOC120655610 isoform X1 [Panicum virgatum]KAG2650642.1 hypothetical protein PVAP13_1NG178700 [Panicum virgatum]
MASRAASEATLLVMVLLLPLRLLSHALRPRFSHPSAAALLTAAALVSAICAVPDAGARAGIATSADAESDALRSEIEALRLKVAQLESLLEENTNTLNSKSSILEEDNKLIEAMERDIQLLMDGPESTKDSKIKSYSAGNIKSMEDEVQQLQQEVSKINKNSDTIESLARDTERRVETLGSEVKKIEDIIAEQWIQIRQFEQAFVLTKMMASKVHDRSRPSEMVYKWPGKETILKYAADINLNDIFLRGASYARSCFSHTYKESSSFLQEINRYYHEAYRFRKAIRRQYIPDTDRPDVFFLGGSVSRSSIAIPYNQFKFFISSTQKFHHKVQVFLHDALESNRYSRGLANEPVTFIMAYLLVVSPMWIAWFLYSTRLGSKK